MRKALLFAPMMTLCLLLCACGGGEETEEPLPLSRLSAAQMEAEVLFHSGGEVRRYTLSCQWTPQSAQVEVLAPEELAGLRALWEGEGMTLSYQDLVLDAGDLSGTDLGPAGVLPALAAAIREGYPLERSREEVGETPCLRITYDVDEGRTLYDVWYTEENIPLRCEVERDGTVLFEVSILRFSGAEEGEQSDEVQSEADLGGDRSGRPGP